MLIETVITSDQNVGLKRYLKDIWNYRDLFRAFVERDIKVRYKQTVLGVTWVLLQPLITAGIFSLIFGRVVKMDSQGLPYPLFYLAALIPWTCFTNALSQASGSLESNAGLIKKVYFPRLIAPGAMVIGTVVDFAIGWTAFNLIAIGWSYWEIFNSPDSVVVTKMYWTWLFIPFTFVLLILQQSTAMGIGLILSVFNVQYRDVRYVIPFLIQVLMLTSPVIWPIKRLYQSEWGGLFVVLSHFNPMAGVIETYRALLSGVYIPWILLGCNFLMAAVLLILGIVIFRRREYRIVDFL